MEEIMNEEQRISIELIQYLEKNLPLFLETWKENILLQQKELQISHVTTNGILMYNIIKKKIEGTLLEEENKNLAHKVAIERFESHANFGEFIYNVNLGRSIIIRYINQSGFSIQLLQPIIDKVNSHFDLFCYYAVTKYSELMKQELHAKALLINQSHKDSLTILGQMSSSFVHEFRNPLTAVIGFTKLLRADNPSLPYLDIIEHELNQLKFRIVQFLHTSKVETMEKGKEKVCIESLFDNLLKFIYPSIVDADVHIKTKIESLIIDAYKDELKQVLLNIFFNSIDAVKQIEHSRFISVNCSRDKDKMILIISNNGPSISPEEIRSIFEPFYTTKELGTGIGLYVCKKIIEKHNGSITCQSDDIVTTFEIHLPIG